MLPLGSSGEVIAASHSQVFVAAAVHTSVASKLTPILKGLILAEIWKKKFADIVPVYTTVFVLKNLLYSN